MSLEQALPVIFPHSLPGTESQREQLRGLGPSHFNFQKLPRRAAQVWRWQRRASPAAHVLLSHASLWVPGPCRVVGWAAATLCCVHLGARLLTQIISFNLHRPPQGGHFYPHFIVEGPVGELTGLGHMVYPIPGKILFLSNLPGFL